MAVSTQRILSQIEFSQKLRNLPPARRLLYAALTAGALIGMFFVAVLLALMMMVVLSAPLGAPVTSFEQVVVLALPILGAMMISVGISGSAMPETVLPGETLATTARRAARSGLISGFFVGFFFSVIWGLVIRLPIILQTVIAIDAGTILAEVALFGLIMALVIAPAYALFRAYSSVSGIVALNWFDRA